MSDTDFEFELVDSENREYALIPEGTIVPVRVDEVSKKMSSAGNERINFKFVVTEGEFNDQWLWGSTPTTFSNNPDCKLMSWVRELLGGGDLPVGFKVSKRSLEGLEGRAVVSQYPNHEGVMKNGVNAVLRPKAAAPSSSGPFPDEEPF